MTDRYVTSTEDVMGPRFSFDCAFRFGESEEAGPNRVSGSFAIVLVPSVYDLRE